MGAGTLSATGSLADPTNPFAALVNPGLLSAADSPRFEFGTNVQSSKFEVSGTVNTDSARFRTRAGENQVGTVAPLESSITMWTAGLSLPFQLPKWAGRRAGLGLAASGPFEKLRTYSTGTPYDFSVLRYGKSDSQFKANLALALQPISDVVDIGVGLATYITAAGAADADLVSNNPTARLNLDVGLNTALVAGSLGRFTLGGKKQRVALVYRQQVAPQFEQHFEGQVQILNGVRSVTLPVTLRAPLYVEPEAFDLEWQSEWDGFQTTVGVSLQRWSKANASFLTLESPRADRSLATTQLPDANLKDTLNPRLAFHADLGQWRVSTGYQFRPSPVGEVSGDANILDCDTHALGVRAQRDLSGVFDSPVQISAGVEYHFLNRRAVTKTNGESIGAPAYNISGNAYSYGLSLQASF